MTADRSVAIALEGVSKRFGKAEAVRNVTLEIREGEFFSLLGPSGCGKTTTLRMIAGFEVPDDAGRIVLAGEGRHVGLLEPSTRQHGVPAVRALPAHVDLRQRRLRPKGEASPRVASTAGACSRCCASSSSKDLERRRPRQLSGGQQQRVAWHGRSSTPGGAAPRRAAGRARREAAQADAARAEADPGRARDDVRLRHARPGRSAGDVRSDRRHERRSRWSRSAARARSTSIPRQRSSQTSSAL